MSNREVLIAALESLPASCVGDVVDPIETSAGVSIWRCFLLRLESEGMVLWKRDTPQQISLTEKGDLFLKALKEKKR